MSEVTGESRLVAGNTNENLAGVDRDVAAAAAAPDTDAAQGTVVEFDPEDPLDDENTFDVSRAEFEELKAAFLRLTGRIDRYNQGAPHKI